MTAHPRIDATTCVHTLTPMAQCADCIAACPHGALSLGTGREVVLDASACAGCGACAGACPARAITLDAPEPVRHGDTLILVCARHPAAQGRPAPTCIHGHGFEDFARWTLAGVRHIATGTGNCTSCPHASSAQIPDTAARFAPLARAHGRAAPETAPASTAELRLWAARADDGPQPARRALLRALAAPLREETDPGPALVRLQSHPDAIFAFAPEIDETACTGCDACVRLCPETALTRINDDSGAMRYHVASECCTGCLICEDVCSDDAIEVDAMIPAPADTALAGFICRACGVEAHPPAARAFDGLCPTCARTGHHRKLFQVLP